VAVVALAITTAAGADPSATGLAHRSERAADCNREVAGTFRCHAHVVTDGGAAPAATATPGSGYAPADLRAAYKIPAGGAGATVAIVDAYDDPTAPADLATYRTQYGLGPVNFQKLNQAGAAGPYPAANTGWAQEIALDLDMASAICPACNIVLVEASSNSYADLGAAVNTAARVPGVIAISNSYGGGEFSSESSYQAPYNHPGIAVTVSSGDSGYGVEFPASSQYVTAVGGTNLTRASNARGWTEKAWSGAGSGCSNYIAKPSFQSGVATSCSRRAVSDVSAVADPNTGVNVYYKGLWYIFGGTSVAAPIVAATYAVGGPKDLSATYASTSALNDVTAGSNGSCRRAGTVLCTAGKGWDGPTGLGTPNGVAAF
jgi:subtilase family serine protease